MTNPLIPRWYSSTANRVWVKINKTWVCPSDVEAVMPVDEKRTRIYLQSGQRIVLHVSVDDVMSALSKVGASND